MKVYNRNSAAKAKASMKRLIIDDEQGSMVISHEGMSSAYEAVGMLVIAERIVRDSWATVKERSISI